MTERRKLVEFAQALATMAETAVQFPPGGRIVVVVTDEAGAWVGVGTNTSNEDTEAILRCALEGEDRQDLVVTVPP